MKKDMSENEKKKCMRKLIRYVKPHHDDYLGGIFFIVMGVPVSLYMLIVVKELMTGFACALVALLGAWLLYSAVKNTKKYRNKIAEIERNGGLVMLLDDFLNGQRAFKGTLILGNTFLIGKRSSEIIFYGEIKRIYQYIESDGVFENKRTLRLELASNRRTDIGMIPLRGKGSEELRQVLDYICNKNTMIAVGYDG